VLDALKKALAKRMLNAEMDQHLGGETADARANTRNGYGQKTVLPRQSPLIAPPCLKRSHRYKRASSLSSVGLLVRGSRRNGCGGGLLSGDT
jgi:hypothetical protein